MGFSLPGIPYPPSREGYWSPVTSTINWCEEDYYASSYVAEIVNTLTNLLFIYFAYKGIASCIRYGHDRVFLVAFFTYLCIGLGSLCFHSTLTYSMQLIDELSMLYTTCVLFYATYSYGLARKGSLSLAALIIAHAIFITGYYHYLGDPVFHQVVFALLTTAVVLRSIYVMEKTLRPSRRAKPAQDADADADAKNLRTLKTMWQMIACGIASIAIGFLIWNLDNIYCSNLRRWRHDIGLPWGVLLEGHGWWHIFTGIAEYFNLTWCIWLRYCINGKHEEVELVWPSFFTLPVVVRKDEAASEKRE